MWSGLLARVFVDFAGNFDAAQAPDVFGDAPVKGFGDLLAVVGGSEAAFVAGVADEGNLREDRWHVGSDQYNKRSFFYSPITHTWILRSQTAVKRALHVRSEFLRFVDLLFQGDLFYQVLE